MSAVQFRGIEGVISGYEAADMPAWQLQQGSKILPFKYEGHDIAAGAEKLKDILQTFDGTNAEYRLRLFEGGKVGATDDGSFVFRLNLEGQEPTVGALQAYSRNNEILSTLKGIDDRLKQLEEEDDDEPEGWQGQLLGVINQPGGLQALIGGIQTLVMGHNQPATSLAGITPTVEEAIEQLRVKVPDLSALLVKLARLAAKDPQQFSFYMSALRNMNV